MALGDVATAFLHAPIDKPTYVEILWPQREEKPGYVWKLKKALYGLRQSPKLFQLHLASCLARRGFRRCLSDPQMCYHVDHEASLSVRAGDLLLACPCDQLAAWQKRISAELTIRWEDDNTKDKWVSYLGRDWRRTADGRGFRVRIPAGYYRKCLEQLNLKHSKPVTTPVLPPWK